MIQLPTTCKASWAVRILVKPEDFSKNLNLKMDNNTTTTLIHLLNPSIKLASATEDDIITLLLESQSTFLKLTYDTLTNQISEVLVE